jgi:TolB-like protein
VTDPGKAVFLSYASQDTDAAQTLCNALRAAGIEVWFDQSELRGGDAWDQKIRREIRDCALFIPIISTNTQARTEGYFRLEWRLADQRTHLMGKSRAFLVPVCIDDTRDADADVPDSFAAVQWTRLPASANIDAFVGQVRRLLSPDPTATFAASVRTSVVPVSSTGDASTRSTPLPARSFVPWIVCVLLILATVYYVADKFFPSKHAVPAAATHAETVGQAKLVDEKSIAVLPFADMSEKHDQEYFADGMAEELIDLLAKSPGLHVVARTSSFWFKGKSNDIPTIAKTLRVANVLQGSVRKAGNRLRITAQLVRTSDGEHLWSDSYDREFSDVFRVQDEIAEAVVVALQMTLKRAQPSKRDVTSNTAAYNEYLRGRHFLSASDTLEQYQHALQAFQKAVALDPEYGAAYAGIAVSEFHIASWTSDSAGYARAQGMAEKAIALSPDAADGYLARALVRRDLLWDWDGMRADVEKALALEPSNAWAYRFYSYALPLTGGSRKDALAAATKAVELDPVANLGWQSLAQINILLGDLAAARAANQKGLELTPDSADGLLILATLQMLGRNATDVLITARKIPDPVYSLICVTAGEHMLGHVKASQRAMDELTERFSVDSAYQIAEAHALRGETDDAFMWLDRAYRQRDGGLSNLTTDPFLASIRSDARYKTLVHNMNLPE